MKFKTEDTLSVEKIKVIHLNNFFFFENFFFVYFVLKQEKDKTKIGRTKKTSFNFFFVPNTFQKILFFVSSSSWAFEDKSELKPKHLRKNFPLSVKWVLCPRSQKTISNKKRIKNQKALTQFFFLRTKCVNVSTKKI